MNYLWIIIAVIVVVRIGWRLFGKKRASAEASNKTLKPLSPAQKKFYTIWMFFTINLRRLFRDRLALFFTFLFPLIFLFVFGGLNSGNKNISFNVALLNQSDTAFAKQFVGQLDGSKTFKVNKTVTTMSDAKERMTRSQIDATIVLPKGFGTMKKGVPTGQAQVYYTQNDASSGQTLTTVLDSEFKGINSKFVSVDPPLTVKGNALQNKSLSSFDYAFTGLLGFAILGAGIFGPINVFPELKKQGILRRLHTTPLRVWQYFVSVMMGNAVSGLLSIAVMFVVAVAVFHLKVVGNYLALALFLAVSIVMILGIGLAIGGWAKNERQAAPLANIVVFPLMFLSGTFFPRFLMPEWLQSITNYLPLTPVIDGARLIATEGSSLVQLAPQIGIIAGWMVVVYFIAFRVFRWE